MLKQNDTVFILFCTQGMDTVIRQVGQHIEFEPEWETAFNLQIKLGPCLTLLLEWCASDVSLRHDKTCK